VNGRLIYIIEFPFKCESFIIRLKEQLQKKFPHGDEPGKYLRSADFYYKNYINCDNLEIKFLLPLKELEKYENYIVRDFYKFLLERSKDEN
jgi:hypothetical protein